MPAFPIRCRSGTLLLRNFDRWISTGRTLPCLRLGLVSYMRPVLRIGERPVFLRRPCPLASDGLGPVSGGVVFSKLSKLLNQEDALSAPWLRGDFCSPQAPSRDAGMLRKGVISHCHITVAITGSSCWQALMLSRWLAADARVERPVQGQAGPS
jgi:hypothetical protein